MSETNISALPDPPEGMRWQILFDRYYCHYYLDLERLITWEKKRLFGGVKLHTEWSSVLPDWYNHLDVGVDPSSHKFDEQLVEAAAAILKHLKKRKQEVEAEKKNLKKIEEING